MSAEQDPMVFGNDETRRAYVDQVLQKMRDTVEQERQARRAPNREEPPATIIGASGFTGSIMKAVV